MAQFKPGLQDITRTKVNASLNLDAGSAITANGVAGTLTITLNGAMTAGGGYITPVFLNSFIESDSLIRVSIASPVTFIAAGTSHVNVHAAAGSCVILVINLHPTAAIADDTPIVINYQIIN